MVNNAVFSSDGSHILTVSADHTARAWPVEVADWLATANCRVDRILIQEEIHDYQVPTPLHFDTATFAQRRCPPE